MACKINVTTPSGFSMPIVGYGTWQAKDDALEKALDQALEAGYRLIDTATVYDNEQVIGKVLKKWIDSGRIKREDVFITTKLPGWGLRAAEVEKYLDESLQKLQTNYVDLYLIHSPVGVIKEGDKPTDWKLDMNTDHISLWKAMEKQVELGKAKAIGVSNFNNRQVDRLLKNCKIPPATNQVEMHILYQRPELVKFHKNNNVTITAYSTLGTLGTKQIFEAMKVPMIFPNLLENPTVVELAKKHKKMTAQILLRHMIEKEIAVIPKSVNPERIKENIDVFGFKLDSGDMEKLNKLDVNKRLLRFDDVDDKVKQHPEYPFKDE